MRAQALGGKLKKGEFRIGRISLAALVQVAHSLTHSRRSRNPSSNEWDSATDGLPHPSVSQRVTETPRRCRPPVPAVQYVYRCNAAASVRITAALMAAIIRMSCRVLWLAIAAHTNQPCAKAHRLIVARGGFGAVLHGQWARCALNSLRGGRPSLTTRSKRRCASCRRGCATRGTYGRYLLYARVLPYYSGYSMRLAARGLPPVRWPVVRAAVPQRRTPSCLG